MKHSLFTQPFWIAVIAAITGALAGAVVTVHYGRWVARREQRYSRPALLAQRVGFLAAIGSGYLSTQILNNHAFTAYWYFGIAWFALTGYFVGLLATVAVWFLTFPWRHRVD